MRKETILAPTGATCNGVPICRERLVYVLDGQPSAPSPYAGRCRDAVLVPTGATCNGVPICRERRVCVDC